MPGMTGTLHVMQKLNPYEFGVEIRVMREGMNRNRWDYRNLEDCWRTFIGQPILIAYVGNKIGDGHNVRETKDRDGCTVYTFTDGTSERIIGTLSDEEEDFSITEEEGNKWLVAKGRIFAFYAREAVEKIVAAGAMDVSAETDVIESETGENGVEILKNWAGLGVTILGDDVAPAIPGARIKKMSALKEELNGLKLMAASLKKQCAETKPETRERMRRMNKREMAAMNEKFNGYTVIGASENGMSVVLMSNNDLSFHGYTFLEEDKGAVVPERITAMRANACFVFGEECAVNVDAGEMLDEVSAKLMRANANVRELEDVKAKLNSQIEDMQKKEHDRRIECAESAVRAYLNTVNASRCGNEKFAEELAEKVCVKVKGGEYCEMEADGKWIGDKCAVNELKALCMDAQAEMDAEKASKKANAYMMTNEANHGHEKEKAGSVSEMMNFLNE